MSHFAPRLPNHTPYTVGTLTFEKLRVSVRLTNGHNLARSSYALSKLTAMQCTRELAGALPPFSRTGVVVNVVCPGLCESDLLRNQSNKPKTQISSLIEKIGRTSEQGSRNYLYAVTAGASSHGHFLENASDAE